MKIPFPRFPSTPEFFQACGARILLMLGAAYLGSLVGAMVYGHSLSPGWHDANPYGLVATVGMAAVTPFANLLLLLALVGGVAILAFRLPLWTCFLLFLLFAQVAYTLRSAWSA